MIFYVSKENEGNADNMEKKKLRISNEKFSTQINIGKLA